MSRAVANLIEDMSREIKTLREALDESVKLQSHYATLLNGYDGGKRLTFSSSAKWIKRLAKIKETPQ